MVPSTWKLNGVSVAVLTPSNTGIRTRIWVVTETLAVRLGSERFHSSAAPSDRSRSTSQRRIVPSREEDAKRLLLASLSLKVSLVIRAVCSLNSLGAAPRLLRFHAEIPVPIPAASQLPSRDIPHLCVYTSRWNISGGNDFNDSRDCVIRFDLPELDTPII